MDPKELNQHLFSLISMFASACWQQMGKIPSQMDGKIHRDIKSAQVTIDMLLMLKDKTKGNLTKTEEKLLEDTISNLEAFLQLSNFLIPLGITKYEHLS